MKRWALAVVLVTAAGCGPNTPATVAPSGIVVTPAASPTTATDADLVFCVTENNRFRAMLGRAPLARSADLETIAAAAAKSDGLAHAPHGYTLAQPGRTWSENEIPWWPLVQFQTVRAVMMTGLQIMWDEGPSGGHYLNIVNPIFRTLGCGVFIANGEITVVQDFR